MTTSLAPPRTGNPYRGAVPLGRGDALYGRDREVFELEARLLAERVVVLHALSGLGKTSLLHAGLLPRMQDRFDVVHLAGFSTVPEWAAFADDNRYWTSVLAATVDAAEQRGAKTVKRRLFVLDQFEEVFTLEPADRRAKQAFLARLGALVLDPDVWLVIALREEYLAELLAHRRVFPGQLKELMRLEPLTVDGAVEAIVQPARQKGVTFDLGLAGFLVDLLAEAAAGHSAVAAEHVEPIHLQLTCHRLWEAWRRRFPEADRITVEMADQQELIDEVADVGETLARHYDQVVRAVAAKGHIRERSLRDWCEYDLRTQRGLRVPSEPPVSGDEGERIVRDLEAAYVVRRPVGRQTHELVELAHDLLAGAIPRANARLYEERLQPLHSLARDWLDAHRADRLLCQSHYQLQICRKPAIENPDLVSHQELDYLTASATLLRRRRNRTALVAGALLAVVGILVIVSYFLGAGNSSARAATRLQWATAMADHDPAAAFALTAAAATDLRDAGLSPEFRTELSTHLSRIPATHVFRVGGERVRAISVASSPEANQAFTLGHVGTILGWDVTVDRTEVWSEIVARDTGIGTLIASPDGAWLGGVLADGSGARFWSRDGDSQAYVLNDDLSARIRHASDGDVRLQRLLADPAGGLLALYDDGAVQVLSPTLSGAAGAVVAEDAVVAAGTDVVVAATPLTSERFRGQIALFPHATPRGRVSSSFKLPYRATALALSPDESTLAVGTELGGVELVEMANPTAAAIGEQDPKTGASAVQHLAYLNERRVLSLGENGAVGVWDLHEGGFVERLRFTSTYGRPIATAPLPIASQVIVLTASSTVERWNVATGHLGAITDIAAFEDGGQSQIVTAGNDGVARRWLMGSYQSHSLIEVNHPIVELLAPPDRRFVVAVSAGGEIAIVPDEPCVAAACASSLSGVEVTAAALLDDQWLFIGDSTGTIWRWDLTDAAPEQWLVLGDLTDGDGSGGVDFLGVAASKNGDVTVVVIIGSGELFQLDLDGNVSGRYEFASPPNSLLVRGEDSELAAALGGRAGKLRGAVVLVGTEGRRLYRVPAMGERRDGPVELEDRLLTQGSAVVAVRGGDPDGLLITVGAAGTVHLWDAGDNLAPHAVVPRPENASWTDALVVDGKLVVGSSAGRIRVLPLDESLIDAAAALSAWVPQPIDCERREVGWLPECATTEGQAAGDAAVPSPSVATS